MKLFTSSKTGVSVVSGIVESVAPDRLSCTVRANAWDVTQKQNTEVLVPVKTAVALDNDVAVGKVITAAGYKRGEAVMAEAVSCENMYAELEGLGVLSGTVLFASKNDEVDAATGQPRLNTAGAPKKPHFDITVAVGSGSERVTHTVKVYNMTDKETGAVTDNIGRYEKLFKNFDRKENPMYVAIITQPGTNWTRQSIDKNGRQWENAMSSHLGTRSLDITFMNSLEKQQEKPQETSVPTPAAPTPDAVQAIPDLSQMTLDGLDELDLA